MRPTLFSSATHGIPGNTIVIALVWRQTIKAHAQDLKIHVNSTGFANSCTS